MDIEQNIKVEITKKVAKNSADKQKASANITRVFHNQVFQTQVFQSQVFLYQVFQIKVLFCIRVYTYIFLLMC